MLTPISDFECGKFGVAFFPKVAKPFLSIYSPAALERERLGDNGHALYQADFFLPAEGQPCPNIGLLAATMTDAGKMSHKIYRFGIMEGGREVYFSYVYDTKKAPEIFPTQPIKDLKLKRPGWHRFQIIFKGQEEIYCCIDRVPTSFSPVREGSMKKLTPGIMVAIKSIETPVVADNLSIQWSAEEVPLPDTPWLPRTITKDTNLFSDGSPLPWFTNPSRAWTVASAQKRPMVVMFYSPQMAPYRYLLDISPNDQATTDLLQRHVLARVDANQLWGAALAQKLNVVRIPTLILMSPEGAELGRAEVVRGQTKWEEVKNSLWAAGR